MDIKGILDIIYNSEKTKEINAKELREKTVFVSGISGSYRALAISSIYRKLEESIYIFTDSDSDAKRLYEDLLFYEENVIYYPSKEIVFYNIDALSGDLRWERLKSFQKILDNKKKIVVSSIDTLISYYPPINYFNKYSFNLKINTEIDLNELTEKLMLSGYERTDLVENIGEFALRGGLIDIYPPLSEYPLRIELFDNEIDSIRTFDNITQRSVDKVKEIDIFPAKEIILTKNDFKKAEIRIKKDLDTLIKTKNKRNKFSKESFENLKTKVNKDLDYIREEIIFDDIDMYFPYFYEEPNTFFDIVKNNKIIIASSKNSFGKLDSSYTLYKEDFQNALIRGNILPRSAERILEKNLVLEEISDSKPILLDSFFYDESRFKIDKKISINQKNLHSYKDNFDILIKDIKDRHEKGYKVVILAGSKHKGERLKEMLLEYNINSTYKENLRALSYSDIIITSGYQNSGFELPNEKFILFSDKDFFGDKRKRKVKSSVKNKGFSKIKSFTELKHGDYVVHINHGIGVFTGIKQIEREDVIKDYIEITYDKKDKLFIPVEQLDMIQRYIGSEGKSPKVNKLGGEEWNRSKAKVKKSIDEVAKELVTLYALREKTKGFEFSKDTKWQREFEDEFMYEDTRGQIESINEIKKDMESSKVMDRLLCGDVGYGKTEVAMRAAFKAVMDNKQVAVMVPTTILSEQHYNTFRRRFQGYPINIEMISRFKSRKEQNLTLKRLKEGNVDIIIGTHRLISKDIKFKDLGLLIIDEEQRFGVAHKERLKDVKKSVDAISLSATPIPRTLHMSLSGIRDISLIDTPPENRYPIQTYVLEYNDQLIRDAILKEKSRDGQVYFVHNRTKDIKVLERYLIDLVPEVTFDVVHGQMKEKELEIAMKNFMDGYTDVLITTTIIETGMDIKNVNTLIINNADKLGLSQLYQLRGRVGRTDRIAYAYLTYQKNKVLTEIAEKRLTALRDFTDLGSGFKIAMKDLEIRGAGNLMGKSQHGQMSVVGYDLYIKMLNDAVNKITGEIEKEEFETKIDIRISAYIPSYYIKNEMQKIEIYKQIASITSEEDYKDIEEELIDRFSDIPDPVYNLMDIARLKYYANNAGISEIVDRGKDIKILFKSKNNLTDDNINLIMKEYRDKIEFLNKDIGFILKYNITSKIKLIEELQKLVIKLN